MLLLLLPDLLCLASSGLGCHSSLLLVPVSAYLFRLCLLWLGHAAQKAVAVLVGDCGCDVQQRKLPRRLSLGCLTERCAPVNTYLV